ncbi:hypothetical protein B0J12DRAFT_744734 [Macrophomina phaseolina]|uniref:NAD-dependent epimerase/dehydratase domain-containing protein n=1 Tax=Macrophomina phaseolina TaxID=35725 RepID=A0ABQ8FY22_9PEZI|nr:hypothetical protein B0J12DRAFT_744734 [Macrophomina phaseolina]
MSGELIVITGVSGHVGFRVLAEALDRGYHVRAITRRPEQAEQIKGTKSVQRFLANLDTVVVKDLLAPSAFDEILKGANGVVHVASPLPRPSDDFKRDIIDPAIMATVGILSAAAKVPSIKRVVITSSIATMLTTEYLRSGDTERVFTENDNYTPAEGIAQFESPLHAYAVGKALALHATERFVRDKKPHFDIINILPSVVIGKNELNTKKEEILNGTNVNVMGPLLGTKTDTPNIGVSVHVNDVARAHIDALNLSIPGNRNLLCSSGGLQGVKWEDAKEVVKRLFTKQVSDGVFPLDGTLPSRPIRLDTSETERLLGWKFVGFEEQVKSVVEHYLELAAPE